VSEAISDFPNVSGYKNLEPRALARLITNWFERVAGAIPPEDYKPMATGETKQLYLAPGLGEISLYYLGSRYLPRSAEQPGRPLQQCEYTLTMSEIPADSQQQDSEPIGWWMPLHLEYGPKLVLDDTAATEELLGSTAEQRQNLEKILDGLQAAYITKAAQG
jgi:hypothetical protein